MNVLVACEFSGIVRDAFIARGHHAWSCDLLPSEGKPIHAEKPGNDFPRQFHHRCDVRELFFGPVAHSMRLEGQGLTWDLMIAFPPCTFLCNSGVRWLYRGGRGTIPNPDRWISMREAALFYKMLWELPVERIALENPIMHGHAQKIIGVTREDFQIVQPHDFGHGETKATTLRLKNLPPLQATKKVKGREARVHRMSPGPNRWKERSRTLPGFAAAMADQWGIL